MNTKSLIDLIEHLTDTWPQETIDVDDLAEMIHETLSDVCLRTFVREHGGCCLTCAIDRYFEKSDQYHLFMPHDLMVCQRMVKNG